MPEATMGKENVPVASPKRGIDSSPQSSANPSSPTTNGSTKNGKRVSKGKMAVFKVHLLDGKEYSESIEVRRSRAYF